MRIFFTISRKDLEEYTLEVARAHAVTDELRRAFPDDDDEELDMIALLGAADDNIATVAAEPYRLVVAADAEVQYAGTEEYPSLVVPNKPVAWRDVAAIFADEPDAAPDVLAARGGDADAFDRCADWDLLWYDPTERLKLARELDARSL